MNTHVDPPELPVPPCDICAQPSVGDFKTIMGPWAYLCELHRDMWTRGELGTGKGQLWTTEEVVE